MTAIAERTGLLMIAHGARDPAWAQPFDALVARLRAARPALPVAMAYLEKMPPDALGAAAVLAGQGCTQIEVLPLFLGAGGHVRRDLPPLVERMRLEHAGITFTLHPAVGEQSALLDALGAIALSIVPVR